jgi:hypothetical protein
VVGGAGWWGVRAGLGWAGLGWAGLGWAGRLATHLTVMTLCSPSSYTSRAFSNRPRRMK